MRKAFVGLLMFSFLFLALMGSVSADTCSPNGGYTSCNEWGNSERYGEAEAVSYVKIQGTTVPGIQISGNYKNGYFIGPSWIPYYIEADRGYVYLDQSSWDSLWNTADCDRNDGKSCRNFEEELGSQGKYYLTRNPGESYSACPIFLGTDYDEDEEEVGGSMPGEVSTDWAWVYTYGAWGWLGNDCLKAKQVECFDDGDCSSDQFCSKAGEWQSWSCQARVCAEGEERCFGSELERCEGNSWANKGIMMNKCDVECLTDSHCEEDSVSETFCNGKSMFKTNTDNRCFDYKCASTDQDELVEACSFSCENIEEEGAICIDKICEPGEKMCSTEGNSLLCENNEWELDNICAEGCEEGECKSSTKMIYGVVVGVLVLLILVVIVLIVRKPRGKR